MPETREQRIQRRLEEATERSRQEEKIKGGIASMWESMNPAQKIGMSPVGFPVTDIIGAVGDVQMYRDEPETRSGLNYALSGLGMLPFVPSVASTVLKKGKASKGTKYTDYVYHITPTKNVKSIKERGLDPLSESNYIKGVGGGRYQDEPMVFAFSNPLDAIQFVSRTRWETPPGWKGSIPKMRDFSIVRIKNRKGKWERDPAQDSDWYMGDSNVAEIQALPHEERVISLQARHIPQEDIVDITKIDDIQKELGARKNIPDVDNPDKFRYSSHPNDRMERMGAQGQKKPPYTGREYVDNVVDIMDKGSKTKIKKAHGGIVDKAIVGGERYI